jgi:hypothetical protein
VCINALSLTEVVVQETKLLVAKAKQAGGTSAERRRAAGVDGVTFKRIRKKGHRAMAGLHEELTCDGAHLDIHHTKAQGE